MRGDLAQEPERPRFVATFLVITGKRESALGGLARILHSPGEQIALTQIGNPERLGQPTDFYDLLEQGQSLRDPPREGVCRAQGRSDPEGRDRDVRRLSELEATLEYGDGLLEVPFAKVGNAKTAARGNKTATVIGGLGNPDPFFSAGGRLAELSTLS